VTHFSTLMSLALALIGGGLVVEGHGRRPPNARFVAGVGAFLLGMVLAQVILG
jgi:hypothetical protein